MIAWGHEVIEYGEIELKQMSGEDIVACQIAEGGAMGYYGGVFLVSSTCLGMGNHLLVKECIYKQFKELSSIRLTQHPETILYNLWMDIVCDILVNNSN